MHGNVIMMQCRFVVAVLNLCDIDEHIRNVVPCFKVLNEFIGGGVALRIKRVVVNFIMPGDVRFRLVVRDFNSVHPFGKVIFVFGVFPFGISSFIAFTAIYQLFVKRDNIITTIAKRIAAAMNPPHSRHGVSSFPFLRLKTFGGDDDVSRGGHIVGNQEPCSATHIFDTSERRVAVISAVRASIEQYGH